MTKFVRALLVLVIIATPVAAQDLRVDFRKKIDEDALRFEGPNHLDYVKLENEGLRWRYTGGKSPTKPVGVRWPTRIKGDFTITAEYEILNVDRPERGNGVGIEMYVVFETPGNPREAIAYARLMDPRSGPIYAFNYMMNNEQGRRVAKDAVRKPTTTRSKQGKLRLTRDATKVMAFAAGDDGAFINILERPSEIGDMDVLLVRISALDGGDPKAELDLRLLEVNIQGKLSDPTAKIALTPPPAPTDVLSERGSGRWLFWVLAIVAVLGVGIFVAVLGVVWLTHTKAQKKDQPANTPTGASAPAAPLLQLQCASCGKRLKVKDAAAGKLVKCPACGHSTRAPASLVSTS